MANFFVERTCLLLMAVGGMVVAPLAWSQTEINQGDLVKKDTPPQPNESKGMPPRASPSDYQAQGKAGNITIAADFAGHSVTTADAVYESEDYIVVEVAFFGPADAHLLLSASDFSLKLKDRKTALPTQPFSYLTHSLKDPEWQPPEEEKEKKSKGGLSTGGNGGDNGPPVPPKMPLELRRAMERRVFKSVLPTGDRPLPVAGLIFFQYRSKVQSLKDKDMQLVYSGPAGEVSIPLQP